MANPPDYGPSHFTVTANGTTVSNHAPVEGLIGGSVVNSTVHLSDYGVNRFTITVIGTIPSNHPPVQLFSWLVSPKQVLPSSAIIVPPTALPSDFLYKRLHFVISYHKRHKPWRMPHRKTSWVIAVNTANLRITWAGIEVVHSGNAGARVTWSGIEAVHSGDSPALITWAGIEVVRAILPNPTSVRPYFKFKHPWVYRKKRLRNRPRRPHAIISTTRRPVVFVTA